MPRFFRIGDDQTLDGVARSLLERTEETCREAEELLDALPPVGPDHETVRLALHRLRRVEQSLATASSISGDALKASHGTVRSARDVLRRIRDRNERDSALRVASMARHAEHLEALADEAELANREPEPAS